VGNYLIIVVSVNIRSRLCS